MTPESVLKTLAVLLGASVALECGVLSGLWPLPSAAYHLIHLLLMAALLALTLALHRQRRGRADAAVPLWFAAGLVCTLAGDYVNSALSSVAPVTPKLSWALLFFALGYSCYIVGMWQGLTLLGAATGHRPAGSRALWAIIPVILVLNAVTWFVRVLPRVQGNPLLTYGSFAFNATIYVLLPWLAIRYLLASRFGVAAVVVGIGVLLLVYSDLVLFDAWLKLPDGTPVPVEFYASNWILYFGGQCLTLAFPPSLAAALDRAPASARA